MKKIIALVSAVAVSAAFSAFGLDISAGARGNFDWALGTSLEGDTKDELKDAKDNIKEADGTWKEGGNIGGGFGIYAHIGLADLGPGKLGVQPEFDMNFNNGYNVTYKVGDYKGSQTFTTQTIDIPVLVTFTLPINNAFTFGAGLGPYLSIPFGVDSISKEDDETEKASKDADLTAGVNLGLAIDLNAGYKVGPGSIVFDVRYLLDFTPTKVTMKVDGEKVMDNEKLFTRRALTLGLGYEIQF